MGEIMAKHRKKRKNRQQPPPLSTLDTCIYNIAMLTSVILTFLFFIFCFTFPEFISFHDESVVLYSVRWTQFLLLFPLIVSLIIIEEIWGKGFTEKRPIFGNKKINYNSTTQYTNVQFLFKKEKHQKPLTEFEKKWKLFSKTSLIVFCIVSLLLGVGSFFGRNTLHNNGTVKTYSIANTIKSEYKIEDISQVTIKSGTTSAGRYAIRPACYLDISTHSGKEFSFCMDELRDTPFNASETINELLNLKAYYKSQGIDILIGELEYVEELIEYYEMNDREKEMLYELFEIK